MTCNYDTAVIGQVRYQHINATVLSRGVHVVTADIELLCCFYDRPLRVDDINIKKTMNSKLATYRSIYFYENFTTKGV